MKTTTCYRYFDKDGQLLYIGITKNLLERQNQHSRTQDWWPEVSSATFTHFETREEAAQYELQMIGMEFPMHNKAGATLAIDLREHIYDVSCNFYEDGFHQTAGEKIRETLKSINEFSQAPWSYKLLFAFDWAMPFDEEGEKRLVECDACQEILNSSWYKKLIDKANGWICDEAAGIKVGTE